jgi:hypothetical protein
MSLHPFDWFLERLDLARWESQDSGARSGFFGCPVHGGSDSLHVTERNGKALAHCFACGADAVQVAEALQNEDSTNSTQESDQDLAPSDERHNSVRIVRGRRARSATPDGGTDDDSTPSASTTSPLDWMAARCDLTREQVDALDLPLSERDGRLVFEFPTGAKLRGIGEGKEGKSFSWVAGMNPPLWPVPAGDEEEIIVCEGEADVICLRASGYENSYSITKGSSSKLPAAVWDALHATGTQVVRLVFDADDAGRKARAEAAEAARERGLTVLESRIAGLDPLLGEKDARDVARRLGYPLVVEDDADEDIPVMLSDVEAIVPDPQLLGRLHPQEHTILYGDGSAGKGVVAAWWVARLTRAGMRVLIVDYEYHMNYEWRPRVEGFGGVMENVGVLQPQRPIWEIAGWLKGQAEPYDYVVVDSVTYACVGEEVEKSVTATRYSMAINMLMKPVLSIAHVTKADADPNHPFGSVFWSNGARVTIALSREKPADPTSDRIMRNPKTNQRGPFSPVMIDWSWLYNDGPPGCDDPDAPPDQRGMRHHLHERPYLASLTALVHDAYDRLTRQLGRKPTSTEVTDLVNAENPTANAKERSVAVQLSKRRGPTVVRRGGSQDADVPV